MGYKSTQAHREANIRLYHRKRQEYITKLGGKCAICGSTVDLQFDHIDPQHKELAVSACLTSLKVEKELSKCQLLCKNCHKQKTHDNNDNGRIKLSDNDVSCIRELYATGSYSQQVIADMYNVHQTHISAIITGKRR